MELFLWTGTIVSITAHHVMWSAEPSAKQLENEKYANICSNIQKYTKNMQICAENVQICAHMCKTYAKICPACLPACL